MFLAMSTRQTEIARGEATRARLTAAAHEILASEGLKGMSTRAVAERAGVALSLVHHHFGGKRGLLLAVMSDDLARISRYEELLAPAETLSQAWAVLTREFRRDLAAGAIRAEWETFVVGLDDVEIIERWQEVTAAWRKLYELTLERLLPTLGRDAVMPASTLAAVLVDFFLGTEAELLAAAASGATPDSLDILDRVGQAIAALE